MTQITDGLVIAIIGMAVVFAFLVVLVSVMMLVEKLGKLKLLGWKRGAKLEATRSRAGREGEAANVTAAIAAAVAVHLQRQPDFTVCAIAPHPQSYDAWRMSGRQELMNASRVQRHAGRRATVRGRADEN